MPSDTPGAVGDGCKGTSTDVAPTDSGVAEWTTGPTHGFWFWYAMISGIALWMVHLTALSALSRLACTHPRTVWAMHAITITLAGATAFAAWLSFRLVRGHRHDSEDSPDLFGRLRFMGLFGLLTELISLILIVWEGLYVPFVHAC